MAHIKGELMDWASQVREPGSIANIGNKNDN